MKEKKIQEKLKKCLDFIDYIYGNDYRIYFAEYPISNHHVISIEILSEKMLEDPLWNRYTKLENEKEIEHKAKEVEETDKDFSDLDSVFDEIMNSDDYDDINEKPWRRKHEKPRVNLPTLKIRKSG